MDIDYNLLGERMRELRRNKGLTQSALAEKTGLSSQYICLIESGKKKASLNSLLSISNALDITLDEFMYGNDKQISNEYEREISELFFDCSYYERKILYDILKSAKKALKTNSAMASDESNRLIIS